MSTPSETLIDLEKKFWQSMVDNDADAAIGLLTEPAVMVSAHGAMKFDHAGYRKMAEQGPRVLTGFDLSDVQVVFPNENTGVVTYHVTQRVAGRGQKGGDTEEMNDTSTWVKHGDEWKCVMHTETPANAKGAN
jgi:ketosteroid isomerase-like protein